jgi:hypothetical protein
MLTLLFLGLKYPGKITVVLGIVLQYRGNLLKFHRNYHGNIVLLHTVTLLLWSGSKLKFFNIGPWCQLQNFKP